MTLRYLTKALADIGEIDDQTIGTILAHGAMKLWYDDFNDYGEPLGDLGLEIVRTYKNGRVVLKAGYRGAGIVCPEIYDAATRLGHPDLAFDIDLLVCGHDIRVDYTLVDKINLIWALAQELKQQRQARQHRIWDALEAAGLTNWQPPGSREMDAVRERVLPG